MRKKPRPKVRELPGFAADGKAAGENLGAYIRIRSVTPPGLPPDLIGEVSNFFIETYAKPLNLESQVFANGSLLLRWRPDAVAPGCSPVVFIGHSDVVPVPENELRRWIHQPFDGAVSDGFVWGRGALDMKGSTICVLEAVAALKRAGLSPRRPVCVLVNPDEEIGGRTGAEWFVRNHLDRLENPIALFDELEFIRPDVLPGRRAALVGVGEKTFWTLKLSVEGRSGHASMPSPGDAPLVLVKALNRLLACEFPARWLPPTRSYLRSLAQHSQFPRSFVLKNRRLFGRLVESELGGDPAASAMLRTTAALTMLRAGIKDNIIPRDAEAHVNLRLLPGESKDSVDKKIRRFLNDDRVKLEDADFLGETPVAPMEGSVWETLLAVIKDSLPDAFVAPSIAPYTTDSRFFARAGIPCYRFVPFILTAAERQGVHGVNERISVINLEQAVGIYARLMCSL